MLSDPPAWVQTRSPTSEAFWRRAGIIAWGILILVVVIVALVRPGKRSVSTVYWTAAQQWWASQDMYGSKELTQAGYHGFLYFPQSAVLSTPLAYLPLGVAEAVWRALGLSVLAWGFWRVAKLVALHSRGGPGLWFALASFLGIPTLTGSAQNGQFNIIITGLMAHALVELFYRRWWRAALLLALGIALKPHVLVFALLAGAIFPPLRWRGVLASLAAFAIGFVHPDPAYAWSQHVSFLQKMQVATRPPPGSNQDLVGLLYTLGWDPSLRFWWVLRGVGAIGTLGLCLYAQRSFAQFFARTGPTEAQSTPQQHGERPRATDLLPAPALVATLVYTLTLAILYIIIFNPRTEGPTYAIMSLSVGLFAARELMVPLRPWAIALAILALLLGFSHALVGSANPWARPALAIIFGVYIVGHVVRRRPAIPLPEAQELRRAPNT